MPNHANPKHYADLERVVTLAEAARMTYHAPFVIRYNIDSGNIAAVKCGHIWLVSVQSLTDWFQRSNS